MMKIVWDDELTWIAQSHANQCHFAHDCNQCRQVDEFAVGQNLFKTMSNSPYLQANWTKAIHSFYDEISLTPLSIINSYKSDPRVMYGHFTQVVWANSWKIGCGYTQYKSGNPQMPVEELYTCNYGPAGNFLNSPMYKIGSLTSQCPSNTFQARDYPALCEAADATGPKDAESKKLRDTSQFYCDFENQSVCGLRIYHQNNAFLIRNKMYSYIRFQLTASQKVSFELPNPIQSANGFCVKLMSRKGANEAKDRSNSALRMTIKDQTYGMTNEVTFGMDSTDWSANSMDLSSFTRPTSIRVSFEVPSGASVQVFEIKSIIVKAGKC